MRRAEDGHWYPVPLHLRGQRLLQQVARTGKRSHLFEALVFGAGSEMAMPQG